MKKISDIIWGNNVEIIDDSKSPDEIGSGENEDEIDLAIITQNCMMICCGTPGDIPVGSFFGCK